MAPPRIALLVLAFGGPQRLGEVESFLFELFCDPDVIPIPGGGFVQGAFADMVAGRRWTKTAAQYAQIGGRSPLVPASIAQAEALSAQLRQDGLAHDLYVAMRYTRPTIRAALQAISRDGPAHIVALALYPHYSFATMGSTYGELARTLAALKMADWPVTYVPAFPTDPDYVAAVADSVREAIADLPPGASPHLLFSAHGLPTSFVRKGDPYPRHIQATVRSVVRELGWTGPFGLAWQSKVGPVAWLTPATDDAIRTLGALGAEALVMVPISFVCDHIETLYELDIEYHEVAKQAGINHWRRAASLECRPRFISALATQVKAALEGPPPPVGCCRLPRPPTRRGLQVLPGGCADCPYTGGKGA